MTYSYNHEANQRVSMLYKTRLVELLSISFKEANLISHRRFRSLKTVKNRSREVREKCDKAAYKAAVRMSSSDFMRKKQFCSTFY